MENPSFHTADHAMGEDLGLNIDRPAARRINGELKKSGGVNAYLPVEELGNPDVQDVRVRDSVKQGFLTAYVRTREWTDEHEAITTITVTTIALGTLFGGIAALKYRNKSK